MNPIKIIKDGIEYAPSAFQKLAPPFEFVSPSMTLKIYRTDSPRYFKKTTLKGTIFKNGNKILNIDKERYYVGKESEDGKLQYYWLDEEGKIVQEN